MFEQSEGGELRQETKGECLNEMMNIHPVDLNLFAGGSGREISEGEVTPTHMFAVTDGSHSRHPIMLAKTLAAFRFSFLSCLLVTPQLWAQSASPAQGDTRIANWQDDKQAAFMMMFDDCCPTHVTNVFPELQKRKMIGTFYVIANKPERLSRLAFWDQEAPASPYAVYGNHTTSHRAFKSAADAEAEIVGCNDYITRVVPGKTPRLISYASPGGVKHATTADELKAITAKHNLVIRPTFQGHGASIHFKTGNDVLRALDKAVTNGSSEYVIFHGVGGDWLSFDGGEFVSLLDGLDTRRADVWITDHISLYKYEAERDAASVRVLQMNERAIRLELTSQTDATLYDQPLTLVTRAAPAWKQVRVTQGTKKVTVPVVGGVVRYDALPGAGPILLESI